MSPRFAFSALALSLALALAAAPGCDSDDGGDIADTTSQTLTPAEASAAYVVHTEARVTAECERAQRCDQPPDHASVDACVAAELPDVQSSVKRDRVAASIAAGNTLYDADAAASCEAILGGSCDLGYVSDILPVCNLVIEGNVAEGGACLGHFECAEPEGFTGLGPYCFEGCTGAFGEEEPAVDGTCTLTSPIGTEACP